MSLWKTLRIICDEAIAGSHTFIWFVTNSPKLSISVKELIEDENNEKLLSIANIWEMAIKQSTGKLSFSQPFQVFIQQQLSLNSINVLNINLTHLAVVASLPLHHRDPFDRPLIT
jgi:PIN domain nuclease of toxin-antitoxin system